MQLSGEALGRKSELIRWGLDFKKWDDNLDLFFQQAKEVDNLILGFGCAHNSLSLPYFKDFLVYLNDKINKFDFQDTGIIMHSNWVDNPEHLAVSALDPKHAEEIQEQIKNAEMEKRKADAAAQPGDSSPTLVFITILLVVSINNNFITKVSN